VTQTDAKPSASVARVIFATGVVAATLAAVHAGVPDSWVATGAAAAMLLLPWALMPRDPGPQLLGNWRRDVKYTLLWSLATFIPFALGFHLWFTVVAGMSLSPEVSTTRLSRFQPDLRTSHPSMLSRKVTADQEVRLWETNGEIFVFAASGLEEIRVDIRPDNYATVAPPTHRSLLKGKFRKKHHAPTATSWEPRTLKPGQGFSFPTTTVQEISIKNAGSIPWQLTTIYESLTIHKGDEDRVPKNLGWIPIMLLLHLAAVALPEEYFFRGFVQKHLRDKLPSIKIPLLPGRFPLAIVVSSLLFASIHLIATPHVSRLAVFFPSLLFGWLYERSGNLSQPIAYHALSNVVLAIYEMIWFG